MSGVTRYTVEKGQLHAPMGVQKTVLVALQVATKYRCRQPTVAQLRNDFGMSLATAYRWRAAWQYIEKAELSEAAT